MKKPFILLILPGDFDWLKFVDYPMMPPVITGEKLSFDWAGKEHTHLPIKQALDLLQENNEPDLIIIDKAYEEYIDDIKQYINGTPFRLCDSANRCSVKADIRELLLAE